MKPILAEKECTCRNEHDGSNDCGALLPQCLFPYIFPCDIRICFIGIRTAARCRAAHIMVGCPAGRLRTFAFVWHIAAAEKGKRSQQQNQDRELFHCADSSEDASASAAFRRERLKKNANSRMLEARVRSPKPMIWSFEYILPLSRAPIISTA